MPPRKKCCINCKIAICKKRQKLTISCQGACRKAFPVHAKCVVSDAETVHNNKISNVQEWICDNCKISMKLDEQKTDIKEKEQHSSLDKKYTSFFLVKTTSKLTQNEYLETCNPPKKLANSEYPFKWMRSVNKQAIVHYYIPNKLRDYKNPVPEDGFEMICFLLTLIFLNSWEYLEKSTVSDNDNNDLSMSEDEYPPEKAYTLCREALDEMASRPGDVMYTRIGDALEHVVAATRAHMLYDQGHIDSYRELVKNLKDVSEMNIENQAGIIAIKGQFFLSLHKNPRNALKMSLQAIEMDPTFAAWYYQAGKVFRYLGNAGKKHMIKEEIEYFEKAVELKRYPKYIVYLAHALQKMSLFILKNNQGQSLLKDMEKRSAELYRESWNLQNDSSIICRKIGIGMMQFKSEYRDVEFAKKALEKSIEICENSSAFHKLGIIYYNYLKDDEAALECFQKAKNIYGTNSEIHLQLVRDPSYDPVDLIEYWESVYLKNDYIQNDDLYGNIGWYSLIFKNDLTKAVRYFMPCFKNKRIMMRFTSYAFCIEEPINMLELLINEILLMKRRKIPQSESEDMFLLNEFSLMVLKKHPDVLNMKPHPLLKKSISNNVNSNIMSLRKKRYSHITHKTIRESEKIWRKQKSQVYENVEDKYERINKQEFDQVNVCSLQKQENQPHDNLKDKFDRNWRRIDKQEFDQANVSSLQMQENQPHDNLKDKFERNWRRIDNQESATVSSGSRSYERGVVDGRCGSNDVYKREHGSRDCSAAHRFNAGSLEGRREHNRRPFANNSRYDVTVTDWRSESKNKGSES